MYHAAVENPIEHPRRRWGAGAWRCEVKSALCEQQTRAHLVEVVALVQGVAHTVRAGSTTDVACCPVPRLRAGTSGQYRVEDGTEALDVSTQTVVCFLLSAKCTVAHRAMRWRPLRSMCVMSAFCVCSADCSPLWDVALTSRRAVALMYCTKCVCQYVHVCQHRPDCTGRMQTNVDGVRRGDDRQNGGYALADVQTDSTLPCGWRSW